MAATTITRHSAKAMIQQLKDDMNHLEAAEMRRQEAEMRRQEAEMRRQEAEMRRQEAETRRQEISINWEIRSRVAQGVCPLLCSARLLMTMSCTSI
ncbi:hypothetical protein M378DRAFT_167347 [Amanita muscaria Koide BX008]|uniref:Uncharacterized protein n=1 Tax=Amanita muscaria (strain Koide BX008) TaxID=946122 RepID=A0A0C2WXP3_AMAMK|nr:hypothetical protein M378DRAFT_167347 [Amanita muscaria Koide BX008]